MKAFQLNLKRRWLAFISGNVLLLMFLLLVLQVSAFGVIYSTYHSRQLFSSLEVLRDGSEEMQVVWRQLLLEQSTLASFNHVMNVASDELAMTVPDPKQIVILQASSRY